VDRRRTAAGGDFPHDGIAARARGLRPFLTERNAGRMLRADGTRLDRILGDARDPRELGESFGGELSAAEVRHLVRHEFAETADDVLWRRSKLGLRLDRPAVATLTQFMETGGGRAAAE
jgi:glycerol-3-phosphate dehydrogenase